MQVIVIWGNRRSGRTYQAERNFLGTKADYLHLSGDVPYPPSSPKTMESVGGVEGKVLWDIAELPSADQLIHCLDRVYLEVLFRDGEKMISPTILVIETTMPPWEWYPKDKSSTDVLKEHITTVAHVGAGGIVHDTWPE